MKKYKVSVIWEIEAIDIIDAHRQARLVLGHDTYHEIKELNSKD